MALQRKLKGPTPMACEKQWIVPVKDMHCPGEGYVDVRGPTSFGASGFPTGDQSRPWRGRGCIHFHAIDASLLRGSGGPYIVHNFAQGTRIVMKISGIVAGVIHYLSVWGMCNFVIADICPVTIVAQYRRLWQSTLSD